MRTRTVEGRLRALVSEMEMDAAHVGPCEALTVTWLRERRGWSIGDDSGVAVVFSECEGAAMIRDCAMIYAENARIAAEDAAREARYQEALDTPEAPDERAYWDTVFAVDRSP